MERVIPSPVATWAVYEQQAENFDRQRSQELLKASWLARFTACLPPQGRVLDLGCGAGKPIAWWFMAEGFPVTGVDISDAMLDIARSRRPKSDWHKADMRNFDMGEQFDGIVAWDMLFPSCTG